MDVMRRFPKRFSYCKRIHFRYYTNVNFILIGFCVPEIYDLCTSAAKSLIAKLTLFQVSDHKDAGQKRYKLFSVWTVYKIQVSLVIRGGQVKKFYEYKKQNRAYKVQVYFITRDLGSTKFQCE